MRLQAGLYLMLSAMTALVPLTAVAQDDTTGIPTTGNPSIDAFVGMFADCYVEETGEAMSAEDAVLLAQMYSGLLAACPDGSCAIDVTRLSCSDLSGDLGNLLGVNPPQWAVDLGRHMSIKFGECYAAQEGRELTEMEQTTLNEYNFALAQQISVLITDMGCIINEEQIDPCGMSIVEGECSLYDPVQMFFGGANIDWTDTQSVIDMQVEDLGPCGTLFDCPGLYDDTLDEILANDGGFSTMPDNDD